ncbi:PREDICTED: alpha-ketoglutarate-dependent [Prunus dulcis]|uniref:PREDICTED: alpha-ketoglutarate-dependent n=1 Tax=Prunus dulcis TaxID=3755 RepID=A0A5E4FUC6_PRUDU|nr:DNA oxidative demethylase ALKBH2 [Prunus dulcis]VVA31044.1 PREDICTED: alpha-ketoglutarate-dependent [Prunus dulcis]
MSLRKLKVSVTVGGEATNPSPNNESENKAKRQTVVLGNGSEVVFIPRFVSFDQAWTWFDYLHTHIPWTRPTIRVFGRSCLQPRDTCYVASPGLPQLVYSGYQPHAYSWDDHPPLKQILEAVHKALPGSSFNSLILNRYKGGHDHVGWHSDDEKLYGSTPEIASLSLGCEREFFLKKKPSKTCQESRDDQEPKSKRLKRNHADQYSFTLKHGSLLVMRGYTQRDWMHSVPKRTKVEATRINLTFRWVLQDPGAMS